MQNQTAEIDVALEEIIQCDLEGFMDLLSERAFGRIDVHGIDYTMVALRDPNTIRMLVIGAIPVD
jgi:ADP-dependent phosphofructokinase/glucokinase